MYQTAVSQVSIVEKVESVQGRENYIELSDISSVFLELLIESEDHRFFEHKGVSVVATGRAFWRNIQSRAKIEGGSSITQQLAKNLYFSFEKQYERKIAELFVVYHLEKMYSKETILELYCNIAYLGEGATGIYEASRHYYNTHPRDLTPEQAKILVKTLKSPSLFNPNRMH